MERLEKAGERGIKREEFLREKLKQGILVGKRGGNSTPSPSWRFGLIHQTDAEASSPLKDFAFPSSFTRTKSARELGANLWEIQPQLEMVSKGSNKLGPDTPKPHHHHRHRDKGFQLPPNQFADFPDIPDDQPTPSRDLKKYVTEPSMHRYESIKRNREASLPLSPGSSGSMEFKGRYKESDYSLTTSTELIKVLNRIWSLEEQHRSNVSLMKVMSNELDRARAQIKALTKEKKRDHQKMDDLMKQLSEDKLLGKSKEQDQMQEAIRSMRNELEDERKLRKHSESLHRKLARELTEVKASFSNALKELERERKARLLLEDLCDEFAKGIRDYEQEMRVLRHKSDKEFTVEEHNDRLILHISEAWLDERIQMKLTARSGLQDKKMVLDKLSLEIETFLQATQSGFCEYDGALSSKKLKQSTLPRTSLESFHLNEVGSAPKNGIEEGNSDASDLYYCEARRGLSHEERNGSINLDVENSQNNHVKKHSKLNRTMDKNRSQEAARDSNLQMQFKEDMLGEFSCSGCKARTLDGGKFDASQQVLVDEVVHEGSTGKKKIGPETNNLLHDNLTHNCTLSSEEGKHRDDHKHTEISLESPSIAGHSSMVERWTSKALTTGLGKDESSLKRPQEVKENTLKAKLLEARWESQQSRSRACKG